MEQIHHIRHTTNHFVGICSHSVYLMFRFSVTGTATAMSIEIYTLMTVGRIM